jgi:hypothetical protein
MFLITKRQQMPKKMLMNKLFQLTLLAATLSTSSSHAVINKVKNLFRGLIPLYTPTMLNSAHTFPPSKCLSKTGKFMARITREEWVTFQTEEEAKIIINKADREGATEIHWFKKVQ